MLQLGQSFFYWIHNCGQVNHIIWSWLFFVLRFAVARNTESEAKRRKIKDKNVSYNVMFNRNVQQTENIYKLQRHA